MTVLKTDSPVFKDYQWAKLLAWIEALIDDAEYLKKRKVFTPDEYNRFVASCMIIHEEAKKNGDLSNHAHNIVKFGELFGLEL